MADIEYLTVDHLSTKQLIRIFSKITLHDDMWFQGTPCWIWGGNRTTDCGYGHLTLRRRTLKTHRLMFAWLLHPIPKGREFGEIDHLCKTRACCNPVHLEFVTARINVIRSDNPPSQNAKKIDCKYGHPLSGDNLFYDQGKRQCRTCKQAQGRKRWGSNKQACLNAGARYRERHKDELRQQALENRESINARARANYHARQKSLKESRANAAPQIPLIPQ